MGKEQFEYYVGLYFWRLNKTTDTVGVFNRTVDGYYWDESEQFQSLKDIRFEPWVRWVSGDVLLREATKDPFQVKDAKAMRAEGAYKSV